MKLRRTFTLLTLLLPMVLISGCNHEDKKVANSTASLPVAEVHTGLVSEEAAHNQAEIVGTLQAANAARIAARISGNIIKLPVDLGTKVQKNDLLLQLKADEITAQLQQASAQLEQARRNLAREESLLKKKAATAESVKTLREAVEIAEAAYQEALTMRDYTKITSPFTGIITSKNANIGDLATPGQILLTVEDETRLQVLTAFPEKEILKVHRGDVMQVFIPSIGDKFEAVVAEVSPIVDPTSRSVPVKLDMPEDSRLRSGQFARVTLIGETARTLIVPATALSPYGQMERIFVVKDNHAYIRLVRVGSRQAEKVELLSGAAAGEEIVISGNETLVDGQPVRTLSSRP